MLTEFLTNAKWIPDYCLTTAWRLPDDCLTTAWWPPEDWLITDQQLQDDLSDTNYDFLKLKRLQDDKNYRLMSLPTSMHSLKTDIVQRQRKFVSSLPEHLYTTKWWVRAEISWAEPSRAGKVASQTEPILGISIFSWIRADFICINKKQIFTT